MPDPVIVPDSYSLWKTEPTPERLGAIIKEYNPLIESEVRKFQGTLPPQALRSQAKRFTIDAIKNYDPSKGAKLSTHIVNTLQKLHRENYKYQQSVRLSEELQRGIGPFLSVKDSLTHELQREPTAEELADSLGWPLSRVERTERQAKGEMLGAALDFDPVDPYQETTDPRLDYVYFDLTPIDKLIMEYTTGYGGKQQLSKKEIAKKLKISPAAVTQRSVKIAKKIREVLGT